MKMNRWIVSIFIVITILYGSITASYGASYDGILKDYFKPHLFIAKITHYDACLECCGKTNGITASGVKATVNHTVAGDFPFGTVLWVDGVRYVVEDRGGKIKGNRLDVFVSSHEEALKRGVMERIVIYYERDYE